MHGSARGRKQSRNQTDIDQVRLEFCDKASNTRAFAQWPGYVPRFDDNTPARPFAALTLMSSAVARFMLSAFGLMRESADMMQLQQLLASRNELLKI